MNKQFFGDSYDIVKQSLLRWLAGFGEWSVLPMFTEPFSPNEVRAYEQLLGAKTVTEEVLGPRADRAAYFRFGSSCGNLFLDPDTGLRTNTIRRGLTPKYLFAWELRQLCEARRDSLTLVFDQSLSFKSKREESLAAKIAHMRTEGIFAFAYVSHACFILTSQNSLLLEKAEKALVQESRLPKDRFLAKLSA